MIIGISGKIKSGKSTVADIICEISSSFTQKSFAYNLKCMASTLTGLSLETFMCQEGKDTYLTDWGMTAGELLQKLGTDAVRNGLKQDAWIISLFKDYRIGDNWVISDTRFPDEADSIVTRGGSVIRVNRPIAESGKRDRNHLSETALDHYPFDVLIDNSGDLDELRIKTIKALDYVAEVCRFREFSGT